MSYFFWRCYYRTKFYLRDVLPLDIRILREILLGLALRVRLQLRIL